MLLIYLVKKDDVNVCWSLYGAVTYVLLHSGTYWSKNGSKTMTSSPGSMNAMNALSMPMMHHVGSESAMSLQADRTCSPGIDYCVQ